MDMKEVVLLDVPTVGQITTPVWQMIAANLPAVMLLVGFGVGLWMLSNLITNAIRGDVGFGNSSSDYKISRAAFRQAVNDGEFDPDEYDYFMKDWNDMGEDR